MKEPEVVCKENNMAGASDKASAKPRNRQWTQTELKYFALVLADGKRLWLQTGHACVEEDRK